MKPRTQVNRTRRRRPDGIPCFMDGGCGGTVNRDAILHAHALGQDYVHDCGRVWKAPNPRYVEPGK